MFRKILIANRGEIAVRVIRTCRDLGVETVAVYSTADKDALHVQLADEAICIGPPAARESYLKGDCIISAALATGAEAIHPGYGFLSENADFVDAVEDAGLVFIGPSGDSIRLMGDKASARRLAKEAAVTTVPGSDGVLESCDDALLIAEKIGYPVLLKASAGGGGKGMRIVMTPNDMKNAWNSAQEEASAAFLNGALYLEKLIEAPKHIEVQILADRYGHVVHYGERDCSLQRNHQKMVEECPCRMLNALDRARIGDMAVRLAKGIGYVGVGTVEFIRSAEGEFYFIEMNTRLQVEHPITELVYGVDLVREQLRIAVGQTLNIKQDDIQPCGHAIECRINVEDPAKNFMPAPGHVGKLHFPGGPGVRIDSALLPDSEVSPWYDAMAAKIIVHGDNRIEALRRMRRALAELLIEGVKTNLGFQFMLMHHVDFTRGVYDTTFIEKNLKELVRLL